MSFTVNQIAHTGVVASNTSTVSFTVTGDGTHTVVIAGMSSSGGTLGSAGVFTDSASNTYTVGTTHNDGGSRLWAMAYLIGLPSSITSVTWTPAGTSAGIELAVWDIIATGPISFASGNSNLLSSVPTTADAVTTSSLAITSSDGLILGYGQSAFSYQIAHGTGFTADGLNTGSTGSQPEHMAISAAHAATWTTPTGSDIDFVMALAFQVSNTGINIAWVT